MSAPTSAPRPRKNEGHAAVRPAAPEEHTHPKYSNCDQPHAADGAFSSRRRFLISACTAGLVGPERVVERVVAEIEREVAR